MYIHVQQTRGGGGGGGGIRRSDLNASERWSVVAQGVVRPHLTPPLSVSRLVAVFARGRFLFSITAVRLKANSQVTDTLFVRSTPTTACFLLQRRNISKVSHL